MPETVASLYKLLIYQDVQSHLIGLLFCVTTLNTLKAPPILNKKLLLISQCGKYSCLYIMCSVFIFLALCCLVLLSRLPNTQGTLFVFVNEV